MPTDPPSSQDTPAAPFLARAGSLLGVATLAALLGSVPAAIRVAHEGGGPLRAWMGLGAWAARAMVRAGDTLLTGGILFAAAGGMLALYAGDGVALQSREGSIVVPPVVAFELQH